MSKSLESNPRRDGYRMPYQLVPIAKPRDGLPVLLQPL